MEIRTVGSCSEDFFSGMLFSLATVCDVERRETKCHHGADGKIQSTAAIRVAAAIISSIQDGDFSRSKDLAQAILWELRKCTISGDDIYLMLLDLITEQELYDE